MRLYIKGGVWRITPTILAHFEDEGVKDEIKVYDYELAVAGLAEIVSKLQQLFLL